MTFYMIVELFAISAIIYDYFSQSKCAWPRLDPDLTETWPLECAKVQWKYANQKAYLSCLYMMVIVMFALSITIYRDIHNPSVHDL